jgi:hypothetical protein
MVSAWPPGEHANPVERGAHEEQHAHPQDGRLAGQEVLEPEDLLGLRKLPW